MLSLPNELLVAVFEVFRDYDVEEWEPAHVANDNYDSPFGCL